MCWLPGLMVLILLNELFNHQRRSACHLLDRIAQSSLTPMRYGDVKLRKKTRNLLRYTLLQDMVFHLSFCHVVVDNGPPKTLAKNRSYLLT